jgi:hypothetical protein
VSSMIAIRAGGRGRGAYQIWRSLPLAHRPALALSVAVGGRTIEATTSALLVAVNISPSQPLETERRVEGFLEPNIHGRANWPSSIMTTPAAWAGACKVASIATDIPCCGRLARREVRQPPG